MRTRGQWICKDDVLFQFKKVITCSVFVRGQSSDTFLSKFEPCVMETFDCHTYAVVAALML